MIILTLIAWVFKAMFYLMALPFIAIWFFIKLVMNFMFIVESFLVGANAKRTMKSFIRRR